MERIYASGPGAALSSRLEVSEQTYRLLFSTSGWNSIVRAGIHAAGQYFVSVDLIKRFGPYARKLGYTGKSTYPLVFSGRLQQGLMARAYPEARVTSGSASLIIRMPVPMMMSTKKMGGLFGIGGKSTVYQTDRNYYANPEVNTVLKTITNEELEKMGEVMAETMQGLISGATSNVNRLGRQSLSLTVDQRQSIAHTTKPQKSITAHH